MMRGVFISLIQLALSEIKICATHQLQIGVYVSALITVRQLRILYLDKQLSHLSVRVAALGGTELVLQGYS